MLNKPEEESGMVAEIKERLKQPASETCTHQIATWWVLLEVIFQFPKDYLENNHLIEMKTDFLI